VKRGPSTSQQLATEFSIVGSFSKVRFVAGASGAGISSRTGEAARSAELDKETPRNTYMNAVKLMLFFIELLKASAIMGDGDRLEILPEMKIF
jgi:hypothetical protein